MGSDAARTRGGLSRRNGLRPVVGEPGEPLALLGPWRLGMLQQPEKIQSTGPEGPILLPGRLGLQTGSQLRPVKCPGQGRVADTSQRCSRRTAITMRPISCSLASGGKLPLPPRKSSSSAFFVCQLFACVNHSSGYRASHAGTPGRTEDRPSFPTEPMRAGSTGHPGAGTAKIAPRSPHGSDTPDASAVPDLVVAPQLLTAPPAGHGQLEMRPPAH